MLRVSMTDGWLNWPRATDAPRPGLRAQGTRVQDHNSVIIRSHGEDCRRGNGEPGGSGPSPGAYALRLHLAMIAPGTRGTAHFHADGETAVYVVSGEADVWHGAGLGIRSVVRAGDFVHIPAGMPHLAVNRGDVTAIAVVARADPADQPAAVVIELPRHLAALSGYPVASGE